LKGAHHPYEQIRIENTLTERHMASDDPEFESKAGRHPRALSAFAPARGPRRSEFSQRSLQSKKDSTFFLSLDHGGSPVETGGRRSWNLDFPSGDPNGRLPKNFK
jgi:hypothetical protein